MNGNGKDFYNYYVNHVFGIKNRVENSVSEFQRIFIELHQGCKICHNKTQI